MTQQLHVAVLPQAIEDGYFDTANANKSSVRVHGGQSSEFPIYPTTLERTIKTQTDNVNDGNEIMVYSVPTGQVVPTSGQVVDSTCECSGVSTTGFYQLTGSVQLKLLNERCSTKLPLPRNPPLLEM